MTSMITNNAVTAKKIIIDIRWNQAKGRRPKRAIRVPAAIITREIGKPSPGELNEEARLIRLELFRVAPSEKENCDNAIVIA